MMVKGETTSCFY